MAQPPSPTPTDLELNSITATASNTSTSAHSSQPPEHTTSNITLQSTPLTHAISIETAPPNGGIAWLYCGATFLINANTWGINSAWAIFLSHYLSHSTFPSATQLQYALIGGLSISQSLLIAPLVAVTHRKLGITATLLIGAVLVSVAWLCASFAMQIWHLFLSVGCCFGYGMGFLYVTASSVLPQWFSTKRSLAVGIAASGAGLGGLAYNLGAGAAVEQLGLDWTYRVLAATSLVCNGLCALVLRDRNGVVKPTGRSLELRELRRVEVDLIVAWGFLTELGYIVLLYSLPHYALSVGLSQKQGSVVGAMLNLGLGVGRPLVGYYSDGLGRINMAMVMTGLCGVFCLSIWIPAKGFAGLTVFAILAGSTTGTFWGTVTAVTTEVVGLKRLPSTFGIICTALVLPTTFAEPLGLELVSASGYVTSQVFVGMVFLLAAVCLCMLRSWKIAQIEVKSRIESEEGGTFGKWQWLKPGNMIIARRV